MVGLLRRGGTARLPPLKPSWLYDDTAVVDLDFVNQRYWWQNSEKDASAWTSVGGTASFDADGLTTTAAGVYRALSGMGISLTAGTILTKLKNKVTATGNSNAVAMYAGSAAYGPLILVAAPSGGNTISNQIRAYSNNTSAASYIYVSTAALPVTVGVASTWYGTSYSTAVAEGGAVTAVQTDTDTLAMNAGVLTEVRVGSPFVALARIVVFAASRLATLQADATAIKA